MRDIRVQHPLAIDPSGAMNAIWSGAEWDARWDAIRSFDVRYDDGVHQIARIVLDWSGDDVAMDVVRFRTDANRIDFFCPNPPRPLSYQSGSWGVESVDGECVLVAARRIALDPALPESGDAHRERLETYAGQLEARLSRILERFARGPG